MTSEFSFEDERRSARSSDPAEALWHFLASLVRRHGCEAITVSTRDGVLLGGVGDGHDLEMLGALAAAESRGYRDEVDDHYMASRLRFYRIELGGMPVCISCVGGEPLPVRECTATLRRIQALAA